MEPHGQSPMGKAHGTIYSPPLPKDGYGETSAMWSRFRLAEARLRLPPWVKPVVSGGGGWMPYIVVGAMAEAFKI